jgi:hypothetical protein
VLVRLVQERLADILRLKNGIDIEVRAASFRRLRGLTCVAVIASECAFWPPSDDGSSNADSDILNSIRPALATTAGPLILITTPYARRGEVWSFHRKYYGPDGDPRMLCVQGPATQFNPTLPQSVVDRALERDHAAASAEYLAIFRADIESFVNREAVEACISWGVRERPPCSDTHFYGFLDAAGGGGTDAMVLAVGHREDGIVIVDCLRERVPPFSPADVVAEFSETLKCYGVSKIVSDRWGGDWPGEKFREHGVSCETAAKPKSDLYHELLPAINSRTIELLDHPRAISQLCSLERRTSRGGRDSIDHPPNMHDDLCNSIAGLFSLAKYGGKYKYPSDMDWVSGPVDPDAAVEFRRARFQQHLHGGYRGGPVLRRV